MTKVNSNALPAATVRKIDNIVAQYAKAEGDFVRNVASLSKQAPKCTVEQWKRWADPFKAAFDQYAPASASVLLSRVRVLFIGLSHGVAYTGGGMRGYYEANKDKVNELAGGKPAKPQDKRRKGNKAPAKVTAGGADAPKPGDALPPKVTAKEAQTVLDTLVATPKRVSAGMMQSAAMLLLHNEQAAVELVNVVCGDRREQLIKWLLNA